VRTAWWPAQTHSDSAVVPRDVTDDRLAHDDETPGVSAKRDVVARNTLCIGTVHLVAEGLVSQPSVKQMLLSQESRHLAATFQLKCAHLAATAQLKCATDLSANSSGN